MDDDSNKGPGADPEDNPLSDAGGRPVQAVEDQGKMVTEKEQEKLGRVQSDPMGVNADGEITTNPEGDPPGSAKEVEERESSPDELAKKTETENNLGKK